MKLPVSQAHALGAWKTAIISTCASVCLVTMSQGQTTFQQNANGQAFNYPGDPNGTGHFPSNNNWSQVQKLNLEGNIIAPSNWNVPSGVSSGDDILIDGNYSTADANYAISSLTLLNLATVSISSGVTLAVSGAVTNDGSIFIHGDGTFSSVTNKGATIKGAAGGSVFFNGTSTAGSTAFTNRGGTASGAGGGRVLFEENSSAGHSIFTNNGGTASDAYGSETQFAFHSTAADGTFNNYGGDANRAMGAYLSFHHWSTAGNGTFNNYGASVAGAGGATTYFSDAASAETGTFNNYGGAASGAGGASLAFVSTPGSGVPGSATAAHGTFNNYGGATTGAFGSTLNFSDTTTAGNATLSANGGTNGGGGAAIFFSNQADGETARLITTGNGLCSIIYLSSNGMSIGSIEGDGNIWLGGKNLAIGGNDLSTTFSGVIQDFGSGGSITKTGSGSLSLTGTNTYTGLTTVNAGKLTHSGPSLTTGSIIACDNGLFTNTSAVTLTGCASTETPDGGTFAQTTTGTLNIQIGGAANGKFGQIIAGTAILAGKLNVTFAPGYQPAFFDSFKILFTTSLSGTFNNGSNLIQVGSRFFKIIYADDGVTLMQTAVLTAYHKAPTPDSPAGHVFLSLTRKNGQTNFWGFFALNMVGIFNDNPRNITGIGAMSSEDQWSKWDFKISYPITDVQYDAAATRITQDRILPPVYSLFTFNCTNWVIEMAAAAGVELPNAIYLFPNQVINGIADPRVFGLRLSLIGAGNTFKGGTVASYHSDKATLSSFTTVKEPFDYSYSALENVGHSNPAGLAASIGLVYDPVNIGSFKANSTTGISLTLTGTTTSSAIISMNWGDGSVFEEQSLSFSHIYVAGTYAAHLLVIDSGAVHSYNMTVVVSTSKASSVKVAVKMYSPVNIPNNGLTAADPVPDFLVVKSTSVSVLPNGHALITFLGIPTWSYTIQATSDLRQAFQSIGTGTAGPDGTFQFDDAAAVNKPRRFYRAKYP